MNEDMKNTLEEGKVQIEKGQERRKIVATGKTLNGRPYEGNPDVRFDEGEGASTATPRLGSLLNTTERQRCEGCSIVTEYQKRHMLLPEWCPRMQAGMGCVYDVSQENLTVLQKRLRSLAQRNG